MTVIRRPKSSQAFIDSLLESGATPEIHGREVEGVPVLIGSLWPARQRAAARLHEVAYRACFKPQLPQFFIERLSRPGDLVHDPFMGRGTTPIEAALLGRRSAGCDVNPVSLFLTRPRLRPVSVEAVTKRLKLMALDTWFGELPQELLVFYHQETLRELCAVREWLLGRQQAGDLDAVDDWIRMVSLSRLTGHSEGFFSVYTLPPNQAVTVEAQAKINRKLGQVPPRRPVAELIVRKTRRLLMGLGPVAMGRIHQWGRQAILLCRDSRRTPELADSSVQLVVTSPPFLNVVDYSSDNWLRAWFAGVREEALAIKRHFSPGAWEADMSAVFRELHRVLAPGGWVVFEVGEVRGGKVLLEEPACRAGKAAGLEPVVVVIHRQSFTKTSHCWGIVNGAEGTNTNRIVVLRKS